MPDLRTATKIETVRPLTQPRAISHVIFDFDGTVSWLRHGWPGLMTGIFLKHHPETTSPADLREELLNEILSLNGKPTIHQMECFAARLRNVGAPARDPEALLEEYQSALNLKILERMNRVQEGSSVLDDYLVFGARSLIENLHRRGLKLFILSGTIEHRVREEAQFLQVSSYFGSHIYGGHAELGKFSKRQVISRILTEENISGENLLSIGDGPVEMENTKEVGGIAVGVASDEFNNGSGICDPHKRNQLIRAGADFIIADYRSPEDWLDLIIKK